MSLQSRSIGGLLSEVSMVMCIDVVGDQPTDRTSSTQSWCDCQSHLAGSQETCLRNGRWTLPTGTTSSIHARKVLLRAVNLRHGTDGFTSPPKEVVLRIFITLNNSSPSVEIEPANLGPSGEHASPPRATRYIAFTDKVTDTTYLIDNAVPDKHNFQKEHASRCIRSIKILQSK
jgi:hypothetical protein